MLHFYPGPSKLHAEINLHIQEALASGILSMNHRSGDFMNLYEIIQSRFEQYLHIPHGYKVYFTSSATECWSILNQSFPTKNFLHIFNGAFGEKWMQVSIESKHAQHIHPFDLNSDVTDSTFNTLKKTDIVCTTLVETSNGSYLSKNAQLHIRTQFPDALIAVDATSGMGGMDMNWNLGDIWFASVQKCFGLPSGLGILILSPQAQEKINQNSFATQYNSFKNIVVNGSQFQTTHTPNILGIFLLSERLKEIKNSDFLKLKERMNALYTHFSSHTALQPLIIEQSMQSPTVLALKGDKAYIQQIKNSLQEKNIIIGNGYGIWKENTIRIANFPAHTDDDFEKLLSEL